jgi:phage terminase small subunit
MATIRQKRLVDNLLKTVSKGKKATVTQAMMDAGYSKATSKCKQREFLQRKGVQECLRAAGITHDRLAKKFSKLIDAQKTVYQQQGEGQTVASKEDDFRIQLDTAKFCAVLTKMSYTESGEEAGATNVVNIYIPQQEAS